MIQLHIRQLFLSLSLLLLTLLSPSLSFSAEIGDGGGSDYPGTLDTDSTLETTSTSARSDVPNDLGAAIVAIQGELGTDPAGSTATVDARIDTEHDADGTHSSVTVSGTLDVTGATTVAAITASGNLIANANTTLGNAAADVLTATGTWAGASPFIFEGTTADDFETTFAMTDPTTPDKTITFPNRTFTVGGIANMSARLDHDASAAGAVATTGMGFQPDVIFLFCGGTGATMAEASSIGMSVGTDETVVMTSASTNEYTEGKIAFVTDTTPTGLTAVVTSLDADGFTLTWSELNSGTDTATNCSAYGLEYET